MARRPQKSPSRWNSRAPTTGGGWAMTSGAAVNAMVAPWFERRRSAALSHALNGASVAGVLLTPIWIALIRGFGFPVAAAALSAAMLLTIWPLAGLYLRPSPESMGLLPDGRAACAAPDAVDDTLAPARPPLSRVALLRQPRFATLSAAFALALFAQVGLLAHLVHLVLEIPDVAAHVLEIATRGALLVADLRQDAEGEVGRLHAAFSLA